MPYDTKPDVRLGDVVVSKSEKGHPGIVQIEYGKEEEEGFVASDTLLKPDDSLQRSAETLIQDFQPTEDHRSSLQNLIQYLLKACSEEDTYSWQHPGDDQDLLFESDYPCANRDRCPEECDADRLVRRATRSKKLSKLHGGLIASSSRVIKSAAARDAIVKNCKQGTVLCFEMEAYAIAMLKQCLTIKGICDYSDSHKNKRWQPYASVVAAAFARLVVLGLSQGPRNSVSPTVSALPNLGPRSMRPQNSISSETSVLPKLGSMSMARVSSEELHSANRQSSFEQAPLKGLRIRTEANPPGAIRTLSASGSSSITNKNTRDSPLGQRGRNVRLGSEPVLLRRDQLRERPSDVISGSDMDDDSQVLQSVGTGFSSSRTNSMSVSPTTQSKQ